MLKKDAMIPGARVRVLPVIKDGLPAAYGGSEVKDHMLMTDTAGAVFEDHHEITSGAILTVVEGPKKRKGITTIIVEIKGVTGHVFWCEARVSCEHIVPKAVRYDKNAYRIELDGKQIATALRLSNDQWGLYDIDEKALTKRTWAKPADVAKAYDEVMATKS